MPTIDVDCAELERMLGIRFRGDFEKLGDVLALAKGELKGVDEKEGLMSIEIKDTNRPDIWNIEGLARTLRVFLGLDEGLRRYSVGKPMLETHVDPGLRNIRPYIGCSVVKNVKLADPIIRGLMHLQDKLDQTYGRNRKKTSIGLYDFNLIAPPLSYSVTKPTAVSFIPLGFEEKMNLKEILQKHPKGLEYGHIVNRHPVYPILKDSEDKVLSFPPVINSNDLGRITEQTHNVLVEVTGTSHETVLNTLKIVTLSLIDRGGKAYSSKIHYPHENSEVTTPSFETSKRDLEVEYTNKVLGLKLSANQIAELLRKAGFGATVDNKKNVTVEIPCYRIDIMHPIDLVEDIAIAYGYDKIKPLWRKLPTTGSEIPEKAFLNTSRELMIGLGFQEVITYTMTNPENLFTKMNCTKTRILEVANPKVQTLTCLRNWLLPSLMEFLSANTSVEYPQKVFELGKVTLIDPRRETRTRDDDYLSAVIAHANASFSEMKSDLDAFLLNLDLRWTVKATRHGSFIEGRVGSVMINGANIGIIGEINPIVLEAWKLENPVAAFELDMDSLFKIKQKKA